MRISDWSSYVCSSDLFVFVVTWASLQPPRPAAFPAATARPLRGVALSVPSFPALRRLLLSACLAAAVALPFGSAAKDETLQLQSEEPRVGKEFGSTSRSRWSPDH